jgi:hypothetical protein
MSESLSAWLSLRELTDAHARSRVLTDLLVEVLPPESPLRVVDLGTGTGANIRYLAPRLRRPQQWLVVDRDAALLTEASQSQWIPRDCGVETCQRELGTLDDDLFDGRHLVTASALLDLVSERWLESLAAQCRRVGAVALFTLSYNGRSTCDPRDPEDEGIRVCFNAHQRRNDKGFGRAVGPEAWWVAMHALRAVGYRVVHARSEWTVPPSAVELQRGLVEGWASAATEYEPKASALISAWRTRRLQHIDDGHSRIVVGHEDIVAW